MTDLEVRKNNQWRKCTERFTEIGLKRKETREEKGKGKEYLFTKKRIEGNLLPHVLAMYHQREERKRD